MHISAPFIKRPVDTALLTIAVLLAGAIAYRFLPAGPLPQVDSPTVEVRRPHREPNVDAVYSPCHISVGTGVPTCTNGRRVIPLAIVFRLSQAVCVRLACFRLRDGEPDFSVCSF